MKPMNVPLKAIALTLLAAGLSSATMVVPAFAGQSGNTRDSVAAPSTNLNNRDTGTGSMYDSQNTNYHYTRGVKHFDAKNYDLAARSFKRVLREKPQDANANYYMARVHATRGDHKRAVSNYKKSLRHYENAPILLAGLGTSLVKVNKRNQAKGIIKQLEAASETCANVCADAPMIATSLHVVAMALYPAQQ